MNDRKETAFPSTSKRELELRKKLTLKDEENKQLREALAFYAEGSHYSIAYWGTGHEESVLDYGEIARKSLEESK